MKFASYHDGSRDGQLLVVSRDLSQAHYATHIATRLQQVLDDWNFLAPAMQDLYDALNAGRARHAFAFDAKRCLAPLPRAYQVAQVYAYPSHQALLPAGDAAATLLQGAGDNLLGAHAELHCGAGCGLDFEAGVAAFTGDLPAACSTERALAGVRLLSLACSLWQRDADSPAGGAAVAPASWAATVFSPVAVTPDELGEAWARGRVQLALQCQLNARVLGCCEAGEDVRLTWGAALAALAASRAVRAGSVLLAAPVSHPPQDAAQGPVWPRGFCSLTDLRAAESLQGATVSTYLQPGDSVRLDMRDGAGHSVFGAIAAQVAAVGPESLDGA